MEKGLKITTNAIVKAMSEVSLPGRRCIVCCDPRRLRRGSVEQEWFPFYSLAITFYGCVGGTHLWVLRRSPHEPLYFGIQGVP